MLSSLWRQTSHEPSNRLMSPQATVTGPARAPVVQSVVLLSWGDLQLSTLTSVPFKEGNSWFSKPSRLPMAGEVTGPRENLVLAFSYTSF